MIRNILLTGCGGTPTRNVMMCLRHQPAMLEHPRFWRFIGVDCDPYNVVLGKGYAHKEVIPSAKEVGYVSSLVDIMDSCKVSFLHAQPDPEVYELSEKRHHLRVKMLYPSQEAIRLCADKLGTNVHLKEAGIPVADALPIYTTKMKDGVTRPLLKMLRRHKTIWLRARIGAGGKGSFRTNNMRMATAWLEFYENLPFMVEEYLPGRNYAWQGLFVDGALCASVAWERLRYIIHQAAPSGITGTPDVARIFYDKKLHKAGEAAVRAIEGTRHPNGVYGVDFRENKDGVACVTEINPARFFTPSYMYAAAGYNMVLLYFDLLTENPKPIILKTHFKP